MDLFQLPQKYKQTNFVACAREQTDRLLFAEVIDNFC
jgi:hypothetical protein